MLIIQLSKLQVKYLISNDLSLFLDVFYHIDNISRDKTRGQQAEIYIQSAPNNSYETYTLCVWAEPAVLGSDKAALKSKFKI